MYERRQLTGSIDGSLLRYQSYSGVEHLVAPVIALVGDVVVRPSNSLGPEYVPADVLSLIPESWNGRPVVYNHPSNDTGSANDPSILDSMCFGSMFNTTFEDKKLKAEVWLDKSKAESIGAGEAVERLSNTETVEVSVGAFVLLKKESGVANGQPYEYIWQGVIPDHLALLENGSIGACSVEMGCGTPRLMKEGGVNVTDTNTQVSTSNTDQTESRLMKRLQKMFNWAFRSSEVSDINLRWQLDDVLRDIEPGYMWLERIYFESKRVIFTCYTEKIYHTYQRTYELTNDIVSINDDRVEGEITSVFKPFGSGVDTTTTTIVQATHACDCQNSQDKESNNKEADEVKNPIIDRLISKKLVAETDRAKIEALPDSLIVALAATLEGESTEEIEGEKKGENGKEKEKEGTTSPAPTTTTPVNEEPKTLTAEQFMAMAPESIRKLVTRAEQEEKVRRTSYITQLSTAQTLYTAEQLNTKTTDQLEEIYKLLGLHTKTSSTSIESVTLDYSGLSVGSPSSSTDTYTYTPPDPWGIVDRTDRNDRSRKEAN